MLTAAKAAAQAIPKASLEANPGIVLLPSKAAPRRLLRWRHDSPRRQSVKRACGTHSPYNPRQRDRTYRFKAESDTALRELTQKFAGEWAYQIAEVHGFRGEIDEAFAWLDRAYAQRDGGCSEMKGDSLLKKLEGDPRYKPKAVLFDLFHTLACVPPPGLAGEATVPQILGVPAAEWQRLYYDDDVLGRCLGRVADGVDAMRRVTHSIDPTVPEERILAAVESRRRRFEMGLIGIEGGILTALDRLRAAGIRTALVSDAGADDVESWQRSPLCDRFDAIVFSYQLGIRKPDARIYQCALDTVGALAAEAIFVGDGGSDEHRGARAVGMRTVLVTRLAALWRPEAIAARRANVDWEFEDVPAFVEALGLPAGK